MFNIPILFLIFNRVETTQLVFNIIKKIKPNKLYIIADGPRKDNELDIKKCIEVRKIIDQIDWNCNLIYEFRSINLGTKIGVENAISSFFEKEEMGIILEDDCLPSISFFEYCNQLLIKYQKNEDILFISGNGRIKSKKQTESYQFTKSAGIWGWATWKRAWKNYKNTIEIDSQFDNQIFKYFNNNSEYLYWSNIFKNYHKNELTWDYCWHYSVFKIEGKVIYPCQNLVKNIGFDQNATHTKNTKNLFAEFDAKEIDFPLTHPKNNVINQDYDLLRSYKMIELINNNTKSFSTRLKKWIKSLILET